MMSPSERAIALFLSKVSSNRSRAILYLGMTDSNVDDAVALFNSKPDASFRAAISRSAVQFRRPLANGAKGYEDKYGIIHLETSTEDENDEDIEIVGGLTGGNEQIRMKEFGENILYATREALRICEPKFIYPIAEHPPPRAATSEYEEAPGTMSRSYLGGQIAIKSAKKRAKKNRRASNRDPTFEPEETSDPFDQTSPKGQKRLPRHRHRGSFPRKGKLPDYKALGTADDGKPISARTRRSTIAQLTKKNQRPRPRSSLPTYKRSPRKRVTVICSLCQTVNPDDQTDQSNSKASTPPPTPRKGIPYPTTPATPTYRSALLSSVEYEPYFSPQETAQSRFKKARKNFSGVANPCTPLSSNVFGMASYPTPVSISSRIKTSSIKVNTSNHKHQLEDISPSEFHRSSFESMSPLAIKSEYYSKSNTQHHQRDTLEIPLQNLYHSNKGNKSHRHQLHSPQIQDPYLASPSSISTFSFISAMNLAREKKKWLLINIQSATNPACGVLNREIWRHPDIADIVSQSFLFLQLDQKDERVGSYLGTYYGVFDLDEEGEKVVCARNNRKFLRLPHIALLDPVSGHRWKVWDGPGLPDKDLFLADLCEYEMIGEGPWCQWGKGVMREMD